MTFGMRKIDHMQHLQQPRSFSTAELDRIFIVVPAYNEEAIIGSVVSRLLKIYPHVVLVDDGSRDQTRLVAHRAGAHTIRHLVNRGQGAAIQTGIRYSLEQGAKIVVTFDGDNQHSVKDIPQLVSPILAQKADFVIGSRFLGGTQNMPLRRKLMLKVAVLFTRIISSIKLTESCA